MGQKAMCGHWISEGKFMFKSPGSTGTAPCFRKVFECGSFQNAAIRLCGLGWHELYVNGQKADDIALKMVKEVYEPIVKAIDRKYDDVVEFK